jgi:hypothetical protein
MDNSQTGLSLNSDTQKWMKLNATLSSVLLFFGFVYSIHSIKSYYRFLAALSNMKEGNKYYNFDFRIFPAFLFVELALLIISYFFIYSGYSKQNKSIKKQDTVGFNKGVRLINYSLIVCIIYFLVLFFQIVFKHFYFRK